MTDIITLRVRVEGRVQGVWYRGWTIEQARTHSLSGWVRNCFDGSVEALFSGQAEDVQAMVEKCRQGPPAAQVFAVKTEETEPPERAGFHQLPTSC